MELSASRTVHGEREIQRVENDHFGADAGRHRHPEHRTFDHYVRHDRSLAQPLSRCRICCNKFGRHQFTLNLRSAFPDN